MELSDTQNQTLRLCGIANDMARAVYVKSNELALVAIPQDMNVERKQANEEFVRAVQAIVDQAIKEFAAVCPTE